MIDVDKIIEEVHRDFEGKEFNLGPIKIIDFEDDTIRVALQAYYPASFESEIYYFNYGNYFITDRGWIFSMQTKLILAERAPDDVLDFHTKGMNKRQREIFLKNNAPDNPNNDELFTTEYYIYRRTSKHSQMRFYISGKFASFFESHGYKVTEALSFQKRFNFLTGKMEYFKTYSIRMSQEVFKSFCINGNILDRGMKYVGNEEVKMSAGRPCKSFVLVSTDGKELEFSGQQECADHFGICVRTVKRALKDKSNGDTVKLKKTNFQLLG